MSKLVISLIIGGMAGIIDILPMVIQKIDRYSTISAFIHWVVLGIIISYIQIPFAPWLKGLIIAELSILPIIALVAKENKKSIIAILIMSAMLGIFVGVSTAKFAV